jgi:hypothetical protein
VPPNVNIIPFKGDERRVLFNLDSNTGDFYANPIILEPDDLQQFQLQALGDGANPDADPDSPERLIRFKNDDPVNVFEVFRISQPPMSWESFYNQKVTRINSDSTSAAYIDQITPNQKYYYTFRCEDMHGHVSNPTHVYEVELVSDIDMVYLKSRVYDFNESVLPRPKTKSLKKRIQISPAFEQTLFPLPESGQSADYNVDDTAPTEHPLWDKKFKIRVTSKSTGRAVEINFKFNKKVLEIDNPCDLDAQEVNEELIFEAPERAIADAPGVGQPTPAAANVGTDNAAQTQGRILSRLQDDSGAASGATRRRGEGNAQRTQQDIAEAEREFYETQEAQEKMRQLEKMKDAGVDAKSATDRQRAGSLTSILTDE